MSSQGRWYYSVPNDYVVAKFTAQNNLNGVYVKDDMLPEISSMHGNIDVIDM